MRIIYLFFRFIKVVMQINENSNSSVIFLVHVHFIAKFIVLFVELNTL